MMHIMKEDLLQQFSLIIDRAISQLNAVNSPEIKAQLKQILSKQLANLDIVSRQEFEQQQQVLQKLQQQLQNMEQTISQLEAQLQNRSG